ncbi:MAG: hypothetical protein DRN14_02215, partial [Thermoplasmata archaeon]
MLDSREAGVGEHADSEKGEWEVTDNKGVVHIFSMKQATVITQYYYQNSFSDFISHTISINLGEFKGEGSLTDIFSSLNSALSEIDITDPDALGGISVDLGVSVTVFENYFDMEGSVQQRAKFSLSHSTTTDTREAAAGEEAGEDEWEFTGPDGKRYIVGTKASTVMTTYFYQNDYTDWVDYTVSIDMGDFSGTISEVLDEVAEKRAEDKLNDLSWELSAGVSLNVFENYINTQGQVEQRIDYARSGNVYTEAEKDYCDDGAYVEAPDGKIYTLEEAEELGIEGERFNVTYTTKTIQSLTYYVYLNNVSEIIDYTVSFSGQSFSGDVDSVLDKISENDLGSLNWDLAEGVSVSIYEIYFDVNGNMEQRIDYTRSTNEDENSEGVAQSITFIVYANDYTDYIEYTVTLDTTFVDGSVSKSDMQTILDYISASSSDLEGIVYSDLMNDLNVKITVFEIYTDAEGSVLQRAAFALWVEEGTDDSLTTEYIHHITYYIYASPSSDFVLTEVDFSDIDGGFGKSGGGFDKDKINQSINEIKTIVSEGGVSALMAHLLENEEVDGETVFPNLVMGMKITVYETYIDGMGEVSQRIALICSLRNREDGGELALVMEFAYINEHCDIMTSSIILTDKIELDDGTVIKAAAGMDFIILTAGGGIALADIYDKDGNLIGQIRFDDDIIYCLNNELQEGSSDYYQISNGSIVNVVDNVTVVHGGEIYSYCTFDLASGEIMIVKSRDNNPLELVRVPGVGLFGWGFRDADVYDETGAKVGEWRTQAADKKVVFSDPIAGGKKLYDKQGNLVGYEVTYHFDAATTFTWHGEERVFIGYLSADDLSSDNIGALMIGFKGGTIFTVTLDSVIWGGLYINFDANGNLQALTLFEGIIPTGPESEVLTGIYIEEGYCIGTVSYSGWETGYYQTTYEDEYGVTHTGTVYGYKSKDLLVVVWKATTTDGTDEDGYYFRKTTITGNKEIENSNQSFDEYGASTGRVSKKIPTLDGTITRTFYSYDPELTYKLHGDPNARQISSGYNQLKEISYDIAYLNPSVTNPSFGFATEINMRENEEMDGTAEEILGNTGWSWFGEELNYTYTYESIKVEYTATFPEDDPETAINENLLPSSTTSSIETKVKITKSGEYGTVATATYTHYSEEKYYDMDYDSDGRLVSYVLETLETLKYKGGSAWTSSGNVEGSYRLENKVERLWTTYDDDGNVTGFMQYEWSSQAPDAVIERTRSDMQYDKYGNLIGWTDNVHEVSQEWADRGTENYLTDADGNLLYDKSYTQYGTAQYKYVAELGKYLQSYSRVETWIDGFLDSVSQRWNKKWDSMGNATEYTTKTITYHKAGDLETRWLESENGYVTMDWGEVPEEYRYSVSEMTYSNVKYNVLGLMVSYDYYRPKQHDYLIEKGYPQYTPTESGHYPTGNGTISYYENGLIKQTYEFYRISHGYTQTWITHHYDEFGRTTHTDTYQYTKVSGGKGSSSKTYITYTTVNTYDVDSRLVETKQINYTKRVKEDSGHGWVVKLFVVIALIIITIVTWGAGTGPGASLMAAMFEGAALTAGVAAYGCFVAMTVAMAISSLGDIIGQVTGNYELGKTISMIGSFVGAVALMVAGGPLGVGAGLILMGQGFQEYGAIQAYRGNYESAALWNLIGTCFKVVGSLYMMGLSSAEVTTVVDGVAETTINTTFSMSNLSWQVVAGNAGYLMTSFANYYDATHLSEEELQNGETTGFGDVFRILGTAFVLLTAIFGVSDAKDGIDAAAKNLKQAEATGSMEQIIDAEVDYWVAMGDSANLLAGGSSLASEGSAQATLWKFFMDGGAEGALSSFGANIAAAFVKGVVNSVARQFFSAYMTGTVDQFAMNEYIGTSALFAGLMSVFGFLAQTALQSVKLNQASSNLQSAAREFDETFSEAAAANLMEAADNYTEALNAWDNFFSESLEGSLKSITDTFFGDTSQSFTEFMKPANLLSSQFFGSLSLGLLDYFYSYEDHGMASVIVNALAGWALGVISSIFAPTTTDTQNLSQEKASFLEGLKTEALVLNFMRQVVLPVIVATLQDEVEVVDPDTGEKTKKLQDNFLSAFVEGMLGGMLDYRIQYVQQEITKYSIYFDYEDRAQKGDTTAKEVIRKANEQNVLEKDYFSFSNAFAAILDDVTGITKVQGLEGGAFSALIQNGYDIKDVVGIEQIYTLSKDKYNRNTTLTNFIEGLLKVYVSDSSSYEKMMQASILASDFKTSIINDATKNVETSTKLKMDTNTKEILGAFVGNIAFEKLDIALAKGDLLSIVSGASLAFNATNQIFNTFGELLMSSSNDNLLIAIENFNAGVAKAGGLEKFTKTDAYNPALQEIVSSLKMTIMEVAGKRSQDLQVISDDKTVKLTQPETNLILSLIQNTAFGSLDEALAKGDLMSIISVAGGILAGAKSTVDTFGQLLIESRIIGGGLFDALKLTVDSGSNVTHEQLINLNKEIQTTLVSIVQRAAENFEVTLNDKSIAKLTQTDVDALVGFVKNTGFSLLDAALAKGDLTAMVLGTNMVFGYGLGVVNDWGSLLIAASDDGLLNAINNLNSEIVKAGGLENFRNADNYTSTLEPLVEALKITITGIATGTLNKSEAEITDIEVALSNLIYNTAFGSLDAALIEGDIFGIITGVSNLKNGAIFIANVWNTLLTSSPNDQLLNAVNNMNTEITKAGGLENFRNADNYTSTLEPIVEALKTTITAIATGTVNKEKDQITNIESALMNFVYNTAFTKLDAALVSGDLLGIITGVGGILNSAVGVASVWKTLLTSSQDGQLLDAVININTEITKAGGLEKFIRTDNYDSVVGKLVDALKTTITAIATGTSGKVDITDIESALIDSVYNKVSGVLDTTLVEGGLLGIVSDIGGIFNYAIGIVSTSDIFKNQTFSVTIDGNQVTMTAGEILDKAVANFNGSENEKANFAFTVTKMLSHLVEQKNTVIKKISALEASSVADKDMQLSLLNLEVTIIDAQAIALSQVTGLTSIEGLAGAVVTGMINILKNSTLFQQEITATIDGSQIKITGGAILEQFAARSTDSLQKLNVVSSVAHSIGVLLIEREAGIEKLASITDSKDRMEVQISNALIDARLIGFLSVDSWVDMASVQSAYTKGVINTFISLVGSIEGFGATFDTKMGNISAGKILEQFASNYKGEDSQQKLSVIYTVAQSIGALLIEKQAGTEKLASITDVKSRMEAQVSNAFIDARIAGFAGIESWIDMASVEAVYNKEVISAFVAGVASIDGFDTMFGNKTAGQILEKFAENFIGKDSNQKINGVLLVAHILVGAIVQKAESAEKMQQLRGMLNDPNVMQSVKDNARVEIESLTLADALLDARMSGFYDITWSNISGLQEKLMENFVMKAQQITNFNEQFMIAADGTISARLEKLQPTLAAYKQPTSIGMDKVFQIEGGLRVIKAGSQVAFFENPDGSISFKGDQTVVDKHGVVHIGMVLVDMVTGNEVFIEENSQLQALGDQLVILNGTGYSIDKFALADNTVSFAKSGEGTAQTSGGGLNHIKLTSENGQLFIDEGCFFGIQNNQWVVRNNDVIYTDEDTTITLVLLNNITHTIGPKGGGVILNGAFLSEGGFTNNSYNVSGVVINEKLTVVKDKDGLYSLNSEWMEFDTIHKLKSDVTIKGITYTKGSSLGWEDGKLAFTDAYTDIKVMGSDNIERTLRAHFHNDELSAIDKSTTVSWDNFKTFTLAKDTELLGMTYVGGKQLGWENGKLAFTD